MSRFAALAVQADAPARLHVLHPATGQPLLCAAGEPAWIDLHSMDSKPAHDYQRALRNRRIASRARKVTAEELEAEGVGLLAAVTAAWRLVGLDGAVLDVPCTRDNAAELDAERSLGWLREQVDGFVGDRGNFLRT